MRLVWAMWRQIITACAWALAAYVAALAIRLSPIAQRINPLWVLLPLAPLASLGGLRRLFRDLPAGGVWSGVRGAAIVASAAGLIVLAGTAFARGAAVGIPPARVQLFARAAAPAVSRVSVLAIFLAYLTVPVVGITVAGFIAKGVLSAQDPDSQPRWSAYHYTPRPTRHSPVFDALELLVWLVATPAAFLAGAGLTVLPDGNPLTQLAGGLVALSAPLFGAYGFLRVLWQDVPTRHLRTFVWKAALVLWLLAAGVLGVRAAVRYLPSHRAAAVVAAGLVWVLACIVMLTLRRRRDNPRYRL